MNFYFLLYIITRLDYVDNFCMPFIAGTLIYTVVMTLIYYVNKFDGPTTKQKKHDEMLDGLSKFPKIGIAIVILLSFLMFATPTKNEALVILAGGKTLEYVSTNQDIRSMPDKTAEIITEYLDKTLKELQEKTK